MGNKGSLPPRPQPPFFSRRQTTSSHLISSHRFIFNSSHLSVASYSSLLFAQATPSPLCPPPDPTRSIYNTLHQRRSPLGVPRRASLHTKPRPEERERERERKRERGKGKRTRRQRLSSFLPSLGLARCRFLLPLNLLRKTAACIFPEWTPSSYVNRCFHHRLFVTSIGYRRCPTSPIQVSVTYSPWRIASPRI